LFAYDFQDSVGFWLVSAYQAYTRSFAEQLAPYGITYRQAQVLAWTAFEGPLSQSELAARMLIEPPSLVRVLDRMEECELIERRPCNDDRRKKLIHPLRAATPMWRQIAKCGRRMRELATQGLDAEEVAQLRRMLNKVQQNVSSLEPVA
jgi:MarR family transcriptional regulator for hemolysin